MNFNSLPFSERPLGMLIMFWFSPRAFGSTRYLQSFPPKTRDYSHVLGSANHVGFTLSNATLGLLNFDLFSDRARKPSSALPGQSVCYADQASSLPDRSLFAGHALSVTTLSPGFQRRVLFSGRSYSPRCRPRQHRHNGKRPPPQEALSDPLSRRGAHPNFPRLRTLGVDSSLSSPTPGSASRHHRPQ